MQTSGSLATATSWTPSRYTGGYQAVRQPYDFSRVAPRGYTAVRRPYNFRPFAAGMQAETTAGTTSPTIAIGSRMAPATTPTSTVLGAAGEIAAATATLAAVYSLTSPTHVENGSLDNTIVKNASGSGRFITPPSKRTRVDNPISLGERGPKKGTVRIYGPRRYRGSGFQTSYKTWTNRRKTKYARKKA